MQHSQGCTVDSSDCFMIVAVGDSSDDAGRPGQSCGASRPKRSHEESEDRSCWCCTGRLRSVETKSRDKRNICLVSLDFFYEAIVFLFVFNPELFIEHGAAAGARGAGQHWLQGNGQEHVGSHR